MFIKTSTLITAFINIWVNFKLVEYQNYGCGNCPDFKFGGWETNSFQLSNQKAVDASSDKKGYLKLSAGLKF